jgi:hypothetical protein
MALTDNPFIGLPLEELQQLQSLCVTAIANILKTGRSYAFPGLSLTREDMREIRETLSQLRIAIDVTSGGTGGGKQMAQAVIDTQRQFHP